MSCSIHGDATGLMPGWITENNPPYIKAKGLRGGNASTPLPLPPYTPGVGNCDRSGSQNNKVSARRKYLA